ncbi:retrotransposon hot spot (RHS) protein [Trypanosoma cruzi]|nr:retrotransposon hot spot (RHS) protein [Trypanosoma cruzi]
MEYRTNNNIKYRVLCIPAGATFSLVDFFSYGVKSKDAVWLRMATASGHHTTTSTVRRFTECLAAYFNGWEELSRDMSWEIIYMQHTDSKKITKWQKCDVVNSDNVSKKEKQEIAAFWEEEVRQYVEAISSRDLPREEVL